MHQSFPFIRAAVSSTAILVAGHSVRLESLEVQNPNTTQQFLQLFDTELAANIKLNVTFTVDNTTGIFTANGHGMKNGQWLRVFNTGGALPTGMLDGKRYFVINVTANTFQLSLQSNAAAISVSDNGSGTNSYSTFFAQSFLIPAGDGTNSGAVSKEWPTGMSFINGLCLLAATSFNGTGQPASNLSCDGSVW